MFFFKQKTAYEMRISDWSSDVCASDLWLFALVVLLGAGVAALFANDGAVLILTPIVIAMLRALGYDEKATLAFVMAAGFIADTSSLPLVVSNLVNIVSADFFHIGFGEYALVMVPVDLAAIAVTLAALFVFFVKDIPRRAEVAQLRAPAEAFQDRDRKSTRLNSSH